MKANLKDWTDEEEISRYLTALLHKEAFDHAGLIYGMGHAVYSPVSYTHLVPVQSRLAGGDQCHSAFQRAVPPVSYTHLNKWFRHSQCKGGYPIDFVMEFYGKSFPEAVQLLTGESGEGLTERCV